tara:strand:+ start:24 stop:224 length:201 start_codon:yes stop_codon:yes gene_type:complete
MAMYQDLKIEIKEKEKERKSLNTKIARLKKKNGGIYPPGIAALSKEAHGKLIDVIQLQDKLVRLEI